MKLPEEIKVATRIYQLRLTPDLKAHDNPKEDLDGECTEDSIISLNASNPEVTIKTTLLHEIIHAIGYYLGDNGLIIDERRVTPLANMIHQVFLDNPEILKYIFDL